MTNLPLPALVGLDMAQQALLLLAIEPRLGGLALAASAGTGKSSLARGLKALIGEDIPFIEIPASIDTENLLGGLDLEATLRTGQMTLRRGALARAHGGAAYIDGLNLLTDATANLLLAVLDDGEVRVEREGVSLCEAARFTLIGSYDPAEGLPRQHLLDRIGLILPLTGAASARLRADVVRHNLQDGDTWDEDLAFMRGLVLTAREHLPNVTISENQVARLSEAALAYGVEGHRVDLFAVHAALAAAAYDLRETVEEDDLKLAVQLVILPRATQIPQQQDQPPPPPPDQQPPEAPEPPQDQQQPDDGDDQDDDETPPAPPQELAPPPDQILEALENDLPETLEDLPFMHLRRGRAGSRGATAGRRGRHVRSVPGNPARQRIDVIATLRAAAPWQPIREDAALKANGNGKERHVRLEMGDVRVKQYRSKAGALFCFAVDASGSMALHRMRQAKGAVHKLLEQAYVKRDRVALISFRGDDAEMLMPPTQSVELAKRALDLLPTGGGTPLASALLLAGDVAAQARMRGIMQTVLVLLTDGRANIPLRDAADPQAELQQLGAYVAELGMHIIVVDTKRSYLSRGEARQLAGWLGADYAYLPNASGEQIGQFVADVHANA